MKILKLILFLLLGSILLSATETDTSYTNGQFLCSGIGSGFGSYKDMGTSPLLYRGISGILVFGCLSESAERTWEYRMNTNYFWRIHQSELYLRLFFGRNSIILFTYYTGIFQVGYLFLRQAVGFPHLWQELLIRHMRMHHSILICLLPCLPRHRSLMFSRDRKKN